MPSPTPLGVRGHGRRARPPVLSVPFRSLGFHCHDLIYGCFYLREAARPFCSVGSFSCPLCLRARVLLGEGGPWPFPGGGAPGCAQAAPGLSRPAGPLGVRPPGSPSPPATQHFISIFIFVLLSSWYKLLRRDPRGGPGSYGACPAPAPSPRPPPNLLLYISAVTLLYLCNKEFSGFRSILLRSWCSGPLSVLYPLTPAPHRALQTCVRTARGRGGTGTLSGWGAGFRGPHLP